MDSLQKALKEWAVAVRAMETGKTALVIRKGGIREKEFAVERARFLLYPTYEHQNQGQLKPGFQGLLRGLPGGRDDGPVRFTSFAEVYRAYEVTGQKTLDQLDPYHIWTAEYATSRLKWRPKKPLTVFVLRTFLLPEPVELPYQESYGGCKSWIGLEKPVSIALARPALDDAEFERLVQPALEVLETTTTAQVR